MYVKAEFVYAPCWAERAFAYLVWHEIMATHSTLSGKKRLRYAPANCPINP